MSMQNLLSNVTVALYTIAKTWAQPKGPSVGEWINQLRYILTFRYYSALNKK